MNKALRITLIAAGCVVAAVLLLYIAIGIGAGQHHPPMEPQETAVEGTISLDAVEDGSFWTDGTYYYEAARRENELFFKGYTLHEGGFELSMPIINDTLAQVATEEQFADKDCFVKLQRFYPDGSNGTDILVAFGQDGVTPIAALQRFDGDEEAFELQAYYTLLAGTYTGEGMQWEFLADGTVSLTPDAAPQPYTIETMYHALTDVITLPNGQHIGIALSEDELFVFDAEWNSVEEVWVSGEEVAMRLHRNASDDWIAEQLFCAPMANILFDEAIEQIADRHLSSPDPFTRLNANIMK